MPVILGGGIGGLSAAYYLLQKGIRPAAVLEATDRLGGWIQTERNTNNFIFELGPRTIRPKGPAAGNTLQLIQELGLQDRVIPIKSNHPAAKNRMIYVNKKLCMLPSDFKSIFKKVPPFSKPLYSAFIHDIKSPKSKKPLSDESIYDFAERRFGTEIAKYAVSSMICGICAGDAKEISVRFLMNDLFETEQKYGGVVKGLIMRKFMGNKNLQNSETKISELESKAKIEKWSIYSLKGGLEILPLALAEQLKNHNINIHTNSECTNINFETNGRAVIEVNGKTIESGKIFSSLPSFKLASLIRRQHPFLSKQLDSIPYVNVVVINLQYDGTDILKHNAFGLLVPPSENLPVLGIIFDSCCFDMQGNTVLTIMMGGRWFEQYFGKTPKKSDLLNSALEQIKNILGIQETPKTMKVNILHNCIAQYTLGHRQRVSAIRDYIIEENLPLSIFGSSYDGVGVNDVILSAKNIVNSYVPNLGLG